MINVVYIIPCFRKAGPVNVVYDIVRNINLKQFYVTIIALRKEKGALNCIDTFKALDISIIELDYTKLQTLLMPKRISRSVVKVISRLDNVIIHSHCHRPNIICKYINGYPKITTVHNISIEDYSNGVGSFLGRFLSWQYNHTLHYFDKAAVISEYMQEYYDKWSNNLVKISNGVSVKMSETFDKSYFKRQIGIPEDAKVILILGMLIPRKNVEYAITQLKNVTLDFVCLIIGNGPNLDVCKQIANSDTRFRFEGFKSNIADYFSIADLYISTSLSEGLPLSVLEAVNCGVPCLLSNIRPHAEIARELNVEGVKCFDFESNKFLYEVISSLSSRYDHTIICQKAHSLYSAEVMTCKYENEYKKLIYGNKVFSTNVSVL